MKKIRLGNDITLRVAVTRLGATEDFTGKTLKLLLRSALATKSIDYTIAGNVLTAIWYGTEQEKTGCYTVTLVEDYGEKSRNTVDSCGVFALVSRSCDESGVLTGDQIIDLDLDISVPGNGLSTYELAVLNGFTGTQEEWLATLSQDSKEAAEEAKKTIEAMDTLNKTITKAEETRQQAETKREEASAEAVKNTEAAIADAEDTATHPSYCGADYYWYVWNKTTQSYDKTDLLMKPDAFKISVIYSSVAELEADTTEHADGLFAMVNTNDVENPDDAKLYFRNNGKWEFVVDMSGAIGFTGKTPQITIGTVTAGKNSADASATLSDNGKDADGNPQYKLNFVVPVLAYDDLTTEQIAELQKPATDAAKEAAEKGDYAKTQGDYAKAQSAYIDELKEEIANSVDVDVDTEDGTLAVSWVSEAFDFEQDTDDGTITLIKELEAA